MIRSILAKLRFPLVPVAPAVTATFDAGVVDVGHIPANIKVCDTPKDLPEYIAIISAQVVPGFKKSKKTIIELQENLSDKIVVLKLNSRSCAIVMSIGLYHHAEKQRVISTIRTELEDEGYSHSVIYWSEPNLVANLGKLKPQNEKAAAEGESDFKAKVENSDNRKQFVKMVTTAVRLEASDIHVEVKRKSALVRYTIDSKIYPSPDTKNGELLREIAFDAVAHAFMFGLDEGSNTTSHFDDRQQHSCTLTLDIDGRTFKLRMQSNPTIQGNDLIARIAPADEIQDYGTLADSGYAADQLQMLRDHIPKRDGVILFAGIPNSGKTTSLIRCLFEVPERSHKKIVGIEDPVEYDLDFQSSATIQASVDDKAARRAAYERTLASWLRGNPHVINAGEVRDDVAGENIVAAAQLGVSVLGTLHVGSAMGVLPRLEAAPIRLDMKTLTLPGIFKLIVWQALIPKICDACAVPFAKASASQQERMRAIGKRYGVSVDKTRFYGHAPDCPVCQGRGHKRQTLAAEFIEPNDQFNEAMRQNAVYEAKRVWLAESDGRWDSDSMRGKPAYAHAFKKMLDGTIDVSELSAFGNVDSFDVNYFRITHKGEFRGGENVSHLPHKAEMAA